jgi:putative SOS response-associated peptidase YedK
MHKRMPVILHKRDYDRWLDRGEPQRPPVDLLRPYEADAMTANGCNPMVGKPRNNGPEMLNSV